MRNTQKFIETKRLLLLGMLTDDTEVLWNVTLEQPDGVRHVFVCTCPSEVPVYPTIIELYRVSDPTIGIYDNVRNGANIVIAYYRQRLMLERLEAHDGMDRGHD